MKQCIYILCLCSPRNARNEVFIAVRRTKFIREERLYTFRNRRYVLKRPTYLNTVFLTMAYGRSTSLQALDECNRECVGPLPLRSCSNEILARVTNGKYPVIPER
jgi:hypothetical protein